MKSQWRVTLAALVLGMSLGVPGKVSAQICGDINGDGTVNPLDAVCLAGCVAGNGVCPSGATLPQCNPGPVCGTGSLSSCGDIVGDGILTLPEIQSDLSNLSLSLTGAETLFGLCADGRAGASNDCPNKIGVCAGDNQTACAVAADCTDQGTAGPCNTGVCGSGGTVTYDSFTIDETVGWPPAPGCIVKLGGTVFVQTNAGAPDDTVLCIEPGTTIQGVKGTVDPATLVFLTTDEGGDPDIPDRKAKIDARGTAASPIVFTSDQPPGSRLKGDWAGVMFNGLSTVNRNFDPNPALNKCFATAEGIPTAFGGCIEDDSSGIATFIRAEFGGRDFTLDNELNLWTMNGIGSGTRMDNIQAHVGDDDCLEWFGGTSNHKFMIASGCGDDGIDYQLGYTGSVQFAAYIQAPDLMDLGGGDSRGIEGDGSEFNNNALPRSNPTFCNFTLMGTKNTGNNGGSDVGVMIRRGSDGKFANMIVSGHADAGIELRDVATTEQGCVLPGPTLGTLQIYNSMFHDNGTGNIEQAKDGNNPATPPANCTSSTWYGLNVAANGVVPADQTSLDGDGTFNNQLIDQNYPAAGELYDTTVPIDPGSFTLISSRTCSDLNENLIDVNYIGAFDPTAGCNPVTGPCDWLTKPWVNFDKN